MDKNKKIKKKLSFGPIPEDWKVARLGAPNISTFTPNKTENDFDKVAFIPMDKIPESGIWATYEIRPKSEVKSGIYCEAGDILLAKITPSLENGKQGIVPDDVPNGFAIVTTEVFPIKCVGINRLFCFYILKSWRFRKILVNSMIGTTGRQRVSKIAVENLLIPLPPLPEQKRIAEVLRTVDEAILKVEQEIEHTERLKQGLMQHLLSRGIGHTRFKDSPIGKIPEEWDVVRVKDIGTVITGKTPSTKNDEFWNGDIMFVTPTDYKGKKYIEATERYVTKKGASQSTLIPPKSVLVVCIGSIGEIAINTKSCVTNQQINSIIPSEKIDSEFLYYTLKFKAKILKLWAGTTTTPIIKKSLFEKFTIPLPPLPEQKKIAEILMTVDSKLELLRKKKVHLERIKKGLMNDLLTGKKRLKVNLEDDT